jgi:hypothetical protein
MRQPRIRRLVQVTAVVRAGWGCALLLGAERILAMGADRPIPASVTAITRVLGARQLLQAATTALAPSGPVVGLGAVVDALHAGTSLSLAAVSRRWRRVALIDAVVDVALAGAGWTCGSRVPAADHAGRFRRRQQIG